jgi:DNA-binding MarR family transcriptional regulator
MSNQSLPHPELPYAGTSGHSGSDTSKARALSSDSSGQTARRQRQALALLDSQGYIGLTWKELASLLNLHHGSASGVLSVLHKTGRIARLKESRNGSKVYVALSSIHGRTTERHGKEKQCPHCGGNL